VKYLLLFIISFFVAGSAAAQSPTDSLPPAITKSRTGLNMQSNLQISQPQEINWTRFGISTGVLAASITALHILQSSWWPESEFIPFHLYDDPDYEKNFDKFGHAFGGYYTSFFFKEAFDWSGFDSSQSVLLGAVCGALYESYVEIEDGFHRSWGFSPGDAKADIAGAAFFILRNRIDFLRNFQYKWLFYPVADSNYYKSHSSYNPIDDYEGQSYWLTADIHRMLPENLKQYWPKWLNLAFGIGGINLESNDTGHHIENGIIVQNDPYGLRQKAYYISLDFDMEKLIPESSIGILNFIRRGLSYWHLPAPAFRISPDPRFFVLFPFKMTIGSHAH
jgi:hypothetical protein